MTTTTLTGQTSSGLTIVSGDQLDVSSGGVANAMQLAGGSEIVFFSGVASGTQVSSGGSEILSSGGTSSDTTVSANGSQSVSGGIAFGTTLAGTGVSNGANATVFGGGSAVSTTANSFGNLQISSGGTALDATINNLGTITLNVGGIGSNTTLTYNAVQYVSGGVDYRATVANGGGDYVEFGGSTVGANILGNGQDYIYAGATATGTTVNSGGFELVLQGIASGTTVKFGGQQSVDALASNTSGTSIATVLSGGTEAIGAQGVASATLILSGGNEVLLSGGLGYGTVISSGGMLTVSAVSIASDTMIAGGTLYVQTGGLATGFVDFTASGGVARFDGSGTDVVFSGFLRGAGKIDLVGLAVGDGVVLTVDPSSPHQLVVSGGVANTTLQLDPLHNYIGATFSTFDDGTGGTDVVVTCFATGTHIATPGGRVAVETLRPGDMVRIAGGTVAPVRWLGVQTIASHFADPLRAFPIRIRAGALGAALPERDLLLSPGHALLLDGLLVQAGALVNGTSITRERHMPATFRYYHVELDTHALLLAEGVAAESYLDGVESRPFDNAADRDDRATPAALPYPRVKALRQMPPALMARIATCAELLAA